MDKRINFQQLVEQFAQAGGMSKNVAEQFVKSFFDTVSDGVLKEGLVKIKGFGTFKLVETENRESVNVNTGERIVIEGRHKINFIPETELRDFINKPFAAFDTVQLNERQLNELAVMEQEARDDVGHEAVPEQKKQTDNRGTHQLSPIAFGILKAVVWVLSVIVALWVVIYVVWPAVAVSIFKDMEYGRKPGLTSAVWQRPDNEQAVSVYNDVVQTVAEDTVNGVMPQVAAEPAENEKLVLLDIDERRDLSEFSESDTVNYRMTGVLAEHVVQSGETLTRLALKYYGTKKLWPYIAKFNKVNMNRINAGDVVRIPILVNK